MATLYYSINYIGAHNHHVVIIALLTLCTSIMSHGTPIQIARIVQLQTRCSELIVSYMCVLDNQLTFKECD